MYEPRNAYDAEVIQDLAEKLFHLMKISDPLTTNVWFASELKLMDVMMPEEYVKQYLNPVLESIIKREMPEEAKDVDKV